jgi:hypothetical protein
MGLGTMPYKVKITQANPDIDQGRSLLLQVFDGSANFRNQVTVDVQDPTLQNSADVQNIIQNAYTLLIQQLIADAGDVGVGLQAFSLVAGG